MSDYISREAALAFQDELAVLLCKDVVTGDVMSATKDADLVKYLLSIPAADVRPVRRGEWIRATQPMGWRDEDCAKCSVCGEDFVLDEWAMDDFTNLMHFCPNCGADMREANDV